MTAIERKLSDAVPHYHCHHCFDRGYVVFRPTENPKARWLRFNCEYCNKDGSIVHPLDLIEGPALNPELARRFLDQFGWPHTFQTFDDSKEKRRQLTRVIHASDFDSVYPELKRLNDAGAGIFFTVNQTDGRGRTTENIIGIRALFVDGDGLAVPKWHKKPDIFVHRESKDAGRWHAYWLTNSVPLEKFTECQKRLIQHYRTDPQVHDLPRVMRVPGFIHRKEEPQEVFMQEFTQWKK